MANNTEWACFCCAVAARNNKEAAELMRTIIATLGAQTPTLIHPFSSSLFSPETEALLTNRTGQQELKLTQ
jgi:hypothetical protein